MNILFKLWNNFKDQPDIWFFYGFLITFPLSIRKVITFYPVAGQFNEWTGIYLYLSDIFLALTLIFWLIFVLRNNLPKMSIEKVNKWLKKSPMIPGANGFNFHKVIDSSVRNLFNIMTLKKGTNGLLVNLPLFLVIWSFTSTLWSENQSIAFFRSTKLLEFYFLYLYLIFNVPRLLPEMFHACPAGCSIWNIPSGAERPLPLFSSSVGASQGSEEELTNVSHGTIVNPGQGFINWLILAKTTFTLIFIIGLTQAVIGISQFVLQHSVGLYWLRESFLSPETAGVAKIILGGEKFVRAYGLFPHPNILGGFLATCLLFSIPLKKMFHARPVGCSTWNIPSGVEQLGNVGFRAFMRALQFGSKFKTGVRRLFFNPFASGMFHVKHLTCGSALITFGQVILSAGLILTFSKSAILGLGLGLAFLWIMFHSGNRSSFRGTFGVKHLFFIFLAVLAIAAFWLYLGNLNLDAFLFRSLDERLSIINVSRETNFSNFLAGTGSGQSVVELVKQTGEQLEAWRYQPTHNIFWLIWAELGFVGIFIFALFAAFIVRQFLKLNKMFRACPVGCSTRNIPSGVEHKSPGESFDYFVLVTFTSLLVALMPAMLFDHYLWTIQQGQIMLWLILGLLAGFHLQNQLNLPNSK